MTFVYVFEFYVGLFNSAIVGSEIVANCFHTMINITLSARHDFIVVRIYLSVAKTRNSLAFTEVH